MIIWLLLLLFIGALYVLIKGNIIKPEYGNSIFAIGCLVGLVFYGITDIKGCEKESANKWVLSIMFITPVVISLIYYSNANKSVKKTLEKKSDEIPNPETKKDFELENHLDTKTDKSSPKKISTFEQIGVTVVVTLILSGLLFAAMVIKDDTRCDNTGPFPLFTGCESRKDKFFIYKTLGLTGSGYTQKNYDKNVHALNGKEFCSNYCAKDWYRKL